MKLQRTSVSLKTPTLVRAPRGGQAEPVCYVTAPPVRPKGVCHFVGGAFAGAAPHVTYSLFIDLIASAGYTVVQTAYPVSFRHRDLALSLQSSFEECVSQLRADGRGFWVPDDVARHGIGHSNGALMHLLIGSLHAAPVASNVVIAFNNKELTDAIPIPNFVGGTRPLLQEGRQRGLAVSPEQVRDQVDTALSVFGVPPELQPLAGALGPALSQISSAFMEIEEGTVDFDPTPAESRRLIRDQYNVKKTLLLQYSDDSIDQTPEMASMLRLRQDLLVRDQRLPGTHVTPCGGDIPWETGPVFSPLDALVTAGKAIGQQDLRRTADTVIAWLDS